MLMASYYIDARPLAHYPNKSVNSARSKRLGFSECTDLTGNDRRGRIDGRLVTDRIGPSICGCQSGMIAVSEFEGLSTNPPTRRLFSLIRSSFQQTEQVLSFFIASIGLCRDVI